VETDRPEPELEPTPLEADPASGSLSVPLSYVPRRRADALELDLEDGLILYDRDSSLVHHLNPSARVVWFLCDGSADVGRLADEIADEYGLGRDAVRSQVAGLVAELDAVGLVEDASRDPGSTRA
jgi:hypothetical protein